MKVLMMTSSFPRYEGDHFGPWIWTYVVEMAKQGLEVHVLAPQVAAHPTSLEIPEGVKVHRFAYWWPRRYQKLVHPPGMLPQLRNNVLRLFQIPFLIWSYVRVARRIIQHEGIEVIHAQWVIPSGFAGAILKKLTKRPFVITSQGAEFYLNHRHPFSRFTKWTLGNVDRLLPVSQMMGTRATSYGMDSDRITVVPNAINPIEFHPGIKTSFRTEHRIPITDTVILTVRRLVHEKRVEDVISAFGMLDLDRDQANCWLVIVGDGPERVNLERIASQQDVGHRILFLGSIDNKDLPQIYAASDIYVLSSQQEGLSLSMLEAMACGCWLIAAESIAADEVIEDGVNGDIYGRGQLTTKLSSRCQAVSQSPSKASYLPKEFEVSHMVRRWIGVYGEVLAKT